MLDISTSTGFTWNNVTLLVSVLLYCTYHACPSSARSLAALADLWPYTQLSYCSNKAVHRAPQTNMYVNNIHLARLHHVRVITQSNKLATSIYRGETARNARIELGIDLGIDIAVSIPTKFKSRVMWRELTTVNSFVAAVAQLRVGSPVCCLQATVQGSCNIIVQ